MNHFARLIGVSASLVLITQGAWAQQSLKDVWVASSTNVSEYNYGGTGSLTPELAGAFQALAFEQPAFGSGAGAGRSLIAVDGAKLLRYPNGSLPSETLLIDGAQLSSLTSVAVNDSNAVLFSGYSKPKRVYELWQRDTNGVLARKATGHPQLTDSVYIPTTDVGPGWPARAGVNGGLLAAAGRQILFFPKDAEGTFTQPLLDAKNLPVKSNTQLLSVELVRHSNVLLITTSERTILKVPLSGGTPSTFASNIPDPAGKCRTLKTQRLLVRQADPQTMIVTDLCGQVLRYTYADATVLAKASDPLVAIAVGEGNEVVCEPNKDCDIANGFKEIQATANKTLLVLQFDHLCDPRVNEDCSGDVTDDNVLSFNSLLPQAIRDALPVQIDIPAYMYSAAADGRLGAILVQADNTGATSKANIEIELATGNFVKLSHPPETFPRYTNVLELLNQDIAAYAPDRPDFRTQFEATPVTLGYKNPMFGTLRGFSVVIYGLQFDLNGGDAPPRDPGVGGIPASLPLPLTHGAPPMCFLKSSQYAPSPSPAKYFLNLAACLLADQEHLLEDIPVPAALSTSTKNSLLAALAQVEDKLIKVASGSGPNTGSETFQALLTQLGHYDAALAAAVFKDKIYQNELQVRSGVFKFNLTWNAYPSIPLLGF